MGIKLKPGDILFLDTAPFIYFFEQHSAYFPAMHIADQVVQLRGKYGLKTPDAVQLGTAVACGADYIITNDRAWKSIKELKVVLVGEL